MWPLDRANNTKGAHEDMEFFEKNPAIVFLDLARGLSSYTSSLRPGKLAQSIEGAGKRRIFAIGNYVKQRLLYPIHVWGMSVLKTVPMDGTFDQRRPILRLSRYKDLTNIYSYDLKSATDRWPLSVIFEVQACIWGPTLASSIVNGSLGLNSFSVGPPHFYGVKKTSVVTFNTGQPLGYYGSWALFALSHHYIVWLAAILTYPQRDKPFKRYALLGDDIVIADKAVATSYRYLLDLLGVSISLPKSLISDNGTLEFAKQYWTKSITKDLSPVSMKAILITRSSLGLCALADHYKVSKNTLFRLAGAGFRVRSSLPHKRSRKWDRLWVASNKPPLDSSILVSLWLGKGNLLNPYLKGIIWRRLLKALKPKQLVLPPPEVVFDGESAILEYTLYHNWVKSWLRWLLWYCLLLINPEPSLKDLLSAPMCSTTWKRTMFDDTFKYGLLWKCYDWCGEMSSTTPLPLGPGKIDEFRTFVKGGSPETGFILIP
jgi:hypothetical protein